MRFPLIHIQEALCSVSFCCTQGTRSWSIFHNSLEEVAVMSLSDLQGLYSREFYSLDCNTHLQFLPYSVHEIRVSQVVCMTYLTPYASSVNGNKCQAFPFMQCGYWLGKLACKSYFIHKCQCFLFRIPGKKLINTIKLLICIKFREISIFHLIKVLCI